MAQRLKLSELLKLKRRMAGAAAGVPSGEGKGDGQGQGSEALDVVEGSSTKEKIEKLAFQNQMCLPPDRSTSPRSHSPTERPRSIAICLVIVDGLYHEDIWRRWIAGGEGTPYRAELYIHAKFPEKISSEWVRQRTLQGSFRPEWNSIEVVRAMLAILEKAVKDKTARYDRFIFGTETCIPLYSLLQTGERLFSGEMSWLDAYNEPQHAYENGVFMSVDPDTIPRSLVWKSLPGWILLTRRHAIDILNLPIKLGGNPTASFLPPVHDTNLNASSVDLPQAFRDVYAPEEIFFPTMLAICGHLTPRRLFRGNSSRKEDDGSHQVLKKRVTYAKWKAPGDPNPITYNSFSSSLLDTMRATGAIFGRKFGEGSIPVDHWGHTINLVTTSSHASASVVDIDEVRPCPFQLSRKRARSDEADDEKVAKTKDGIV